MQKTQVIIAIPERIVQKIEDDYHCQLTANDLIVEYSPEIPTKILLPKLYEGIIIVSVNLIA